MISLPAYSSLLETLHSAPLDAENWQRFLAQICDTTHSSYGIFTSNDSALGSRILAHSGMPQFAEAHRTYNESFRHRDPFRERFLLNPRTGVIEGDELCPREELVQTDLYREFLMPMRLHHMTFMVLSMAPRKYELISMWRDERQPELDPEANELLQLLMPHIQTSLQVRRLIGQAEYRARTADALLDSSDTASALLDSHGRVVYMNRAAQQLTTETDGLRFQTDRLSPESSRQRQAFHALIAQAAAEDHRHPGAAIALDRRSGKRPLQVLIAPFRTGDPTRQPARVLILASDPEKAVQFPDAILRALYDLTPAETEIANGLLTGYSLDEVAVLRRVSVTTVRSQMKSLLGKTSTRRQGDLVRLLASLPRTLAGKVAAVAHL